jgi:hypothetical protein
MHILHILDCIMCLIFGLSVLSEKTVTWIFLSRLRSLHAATWRQLGEPAIMMTTFKLSRLLWRRDFNLLADEKIAVVGRSLRFFWLCSRVSFVLLAVVAVSDAYHR